MQDNNTATDNFLLQFKNYVGIKFQLYNSLFTSLPFHKIEKTGILLSLFQVFCEESFEKGKSPVEIVDYFMQQNTTYTAEQEKMELLFRFIQYIERQVVLFDALEDASFARTHDMNGQGTLKQLESEIQYKHKEAELAKKLKDFAVRLVVTAHPTQFYPDEVLGIIYDLSNALKEDNVGNVNMYLQQLGKTPFLKKQKPTPYDEALSLLWYMENVFYYAAGEVVSTLQNRFPDAVGNNPVITMGFWPGGDRDGNPFVTTSTTIQVAATLNKRIIKCYHKDIRKLRHRLTFKGVLSLVTDIEQKLFNALYYPSDVPLTTHELTEALLEIRSIIIRDHDSLFLYLVDEFLVRVRIFGLFFASLDIRQNSTVHTDVLMAINDKAAILPAEYDRLPEKEKINMLLQLKGQPEIKLDNTLLQDTVDVVKAIKGIQYRNGEKGCHRYIISHCTSALDVVSVYALLQMFGGQGEDLKVDITPLFEMIEDLQHAGAVMKLLYENETYRAHLQRLGNVQQVMLGFSDGTKDGGYLMANWAIYKAKEDLTAVAREHGVEVVFFDGRGGPPARGGGKTHQFYASMGSNISSKEIQLTIQGQTISSNFGNTDAAMFNMEKLLHAGIYNSVLGHHRATLTPQQEALILELSEEGYKAYVALKNDPEFMPYLENISPLRFYGDANIGSRPAKRNEGQKLNLDDLRAIPFVGAWSQLKQNLTGYYGVGMALQKMEQAGRWAEVQALYDQSLFFKTMIDNCEMAMMKSFFPLTAHLAKDPEYGPIWTTIYNEYELSKAMALKLAGTTQLMEKYPVDRLSVSMRERIVLPLTTIQQYALSRIRNIDSNKDSDTELRKILEKLVMRCSFGIINAGRNSA